MPVCSALNLSSLLEVRRGATALEFLYRRSWGWGEIWLGRWDTAESHQVDLGATPHFVLIVYLLEDDIDFQFSGFTLTPPPPFLT
jgi:hypothetical protein